MYQGQCHCGKVVFTVESDLSSPFKCNCSFCVRRAATMQKVAPNQFSLNSSENELTRYGSKDFAKHFFCKTCGTNCFSRVTVPGKEAVMVNVGCLEGVDSLALTPSVFDGANKL